MKILMDGRGPPRHGVARHARILMRLVAEQGHTVVEAGPADLTHAQFTDALWGGDVVTAAAAFGAWAATIPKPLVVTLHDVPGADADARRDRRRGAAYAAVIAACDGVIVSSWHEATKVARLGHAEPAVIELPLPTPVVPGPAAAARWPDGPTVALMGFLYPGKGHTEVIAAAARCSVRPTVVSLGSVSAGHDALRRQLRGQAGRDGVRLVVTGPLSGAAMARAAATVTVPVMPNRSPSASASLVTWLGCRRRPLVADGAYSRELEARHPGVTEIYRGIDELGERIDRALADPGRTRLDRLPPWPDVGAEHVEEYQRALGETGTARAS
jgi:hypothetical protein